MRFALLFSLVIAGCQYIPGLGSGPPTDADPPETIDEYYDQREDLLDRLDEAVGRARAEYVAACRVIAIGEKACGGPTEYRVYSATDVSPREILAVAAEIRRLDEYANERFEIVSTCEVVPEPTPTVENGYCVARVP